MLHVYRYCEQENQTDLVYCRMNQNVVITFGHGHNEVSLWGLIQFSGTFGSKCVLFVRLPDFTRKVKVKTETDPLRCTVHDGNSR